MKTGFQGLMVPSLLVLVGLGMGTLTGFLSFEKVLFFNVWMLSVPHTFATFFRRDLRTPSAGILTLLVLALVFVICITIRANFDFAPLVIAYFFAQQFHYSRQSFGFSRILDLDQSRNSSRESSQAWMRDRFRERWETVYYPAVTLIAILGALSKGPVHFFGYALRNPLPVAIPGAVIVILLLVLLIGALAIFGVHGPRNRWLHAVLHFALNAALFVWSQHFILIWFLMNVLHNFQYLHLMVRVEGSFRILVIPYVLSFALIFFSDLPEMVLFFLAVNFTHYLWDARIWRGFRVKPATIHDSSIPRA